MSRDNLICNLVALLCFFQPFFKLQIWIKNYFNWYFLKFYLLPFWSRMLYCIFKCKSPPTKTCVSIQHVCFGFSWRLNLAFRTRSAASVCTTSTSSCVVFGAMKRPSAVLKPSWREELAPTKEPLDGPTAEPASALFSILIPASPCGNTAS